MFPKKAACKGKKHCAKFDISQYRKAIPTSISPNQLENGSYIETCGIGTGSGISGIIFFKRLKRVKEKDTFAGPFVTDVSKGLGEALLGMDTPCATALVKKQVGYPYDL